MRPHLLQSDKCMVLGRYLKTSDPQATPAQSLSDRAVFEEHFEITATASNEIIKLKCAFHNLRVRLCRSVIRWQACDNDSLIEATYSFQY